MSKIYQDTPQFKAKHTTNIIPTPYKDPTKSGKELY